MPKKRENFFSLSSFLSRLRSGDCDTSTPRPDTSRTSSSSDPSTTSNSSTEHTDDYAEGSTASNSEVNPVGIRLDSDQQYDSARASTADKSDDEEGI